MTWKKYRQETLRCLPDLGSELLNSIHMCLGIISEIAEVEEVASKEKFIDENGDAWWYISNYCNIHNIDPYLLGAKDKTSFYWAAKLVDMDKKKLAYSKPYNREKQIEAVQKIITNLVYDSIKNHVTIDEVFEKNTQKLYIRFPDKFEASLAINKDESKEAVVFNK